MGNLIMCFYERKFPALIVCILSLIILVLSIWMIFLSISFNNQGLDKDLGSAGVYATYVFYALVIVSLLALSSALWGFLTIAISHRSVAVIFGCTLLPAALLTIAFGFTI